jgi:hypothetical protein
MVSRSISKRDMQHDIMGRTTCHIEYTCAQRGPYSNDQSTAVSSFITYNFKTLDYDLTG